MLLSCAPIIVIAQRCSVITPFDCSVNVIAAKCSIEVRAFGLAGVVPDNMYGFVKLSGVVAWGSSFTGVFPHRRGMGIVVVDPFNCSALKSLTFDTFDINADAAMELTNYLQLVHHGGIIVAATADEPTLNLDEAKANLLQLGADVSDVHYRGAFAFVAQKGFPAKTVLRKVLTAEESATTQPQFSVTISGKNKMLQLLGQHTL